MFLVQCRQSSVRDKLGKMGNQRLWILTVAAVYLISLATARTTFGKFILVNPEEVYALGEPGAAYEDFFTEEESSSSSAAVTGDSSTARTSFEEESSRSAAAATEDSSTSRTSFEEESSSSATVDDSSTTGTIFVEESSTPAEEVTEDIKTDIVKDVSLSVTKTFSEGEAFIQDAYKNNDVNFMVNMSEYHKLLMIWIYSLRSRANVITDFLGMLLNTRTAPESDEDFLKDYSFQISDVDNILAYLDSGMIHVQLSDSAIGTLIRISETTTIAELSKSAIEYCFEKGYMNTVKLMANYGTNLSKLNKMGDTLVHTAALLGNVQVLRELRDTGLDLNQRNSEGLTPLYYAAMRGNADVIAFLKSEGIGLGDEDKNGDTLLHTAAKRGDLAAAKGLLDAGASVDPSNEGMTPLYRAAQYGNQEMMKYLITRGADLHHSWGGCELFNWAARYNHSTALEKFVEFGVGVDTSCDNLFNSLHWAARGGLTGIAQYLIDHGADVNAKTEPGRTAMHEAAFWCQYDTVELLFKNGAPAGAEDYKGQKPIDMAKMNDHFAMAAMLQSLEANGKLPLESFLSFDY